MNIIQGSANFKRKKNMKTLSFVLTKLGSTVVGTLASGARGLMVNPGLQRGIFGV